MDELLVKMQLTHLKEGIDACFDICEMSSEEYVKQFNDKSEQLGSQYRIDISEVYPSKVGALTAWVQYLKRVIETEY